MPRQNQRYQPGCSRQHLLGGDMLKHLRTLGLEPEAIKTVLLTHSHGDHVGGLLKDGKKFSRTLKSRNSARRITA